MCGKRSKCLSWLKAVRDGNKLGGYTSWEEMREEAETRLTITTQERHAHQRMDADMDAEERAAGCLLCGHEFANHTGLRPADHPHSPQKNLVKDIPWAAAIFKKDRFICRRCNSMLKPHIKSDFKLTNSASVKKVLIDGDVKAMQKFRAGQRSGQKNKHKDAPMSKVRRYT